VIELGAKLGIPLEEADIDLYDASTADEIFVTSTSLVVCPVSKFKRRHGGRRSRAGADHEAVDSGLHRARHCDFVQQYTRHLPEPGAYNAESSRSNIGCQCGRALCFARSSALCAGNSR